MTRFASHALQVLLVGILAAALPPAHAEECTPPGAPPAIENPYGLRMEAALVKEYPAIFGRFGRSPYQSFVSKRNSLRISYKSFRASPEKAGVVISSGRTEGMVKYPELIDDLVRNGYSVYIHDHRGQGYSSRVATTDAGDVEDFAYYVDDLDQFVSEVVVPARHTTLYLLAHSMGGAIATRYLETRPEQPFRAAVLASPMHRPDTSLHGMPTLPIACVVAPFLALFSPSGYVLGKGPFDDVRTCESAELTFSSARFKISQDAYKSAAPAGVPNPSAKVGGPSHRWLAEVCRVLEPMIADAPKIRIPVLVLEAEKDTAVVNAAHQEFCDALASNGIGCAGGTAQRIDGAWHELFIERDEYRVAALNRIFRFFDSQLPAQRPAR